MAKGVLGNDPFQRGAAEPAEKKAAAAKPAAKKAAAPKGAAKKAAAKNAAVAKKAPVAKKAGAAKKAKPAQRVAAASSRDAESAPAAAEAAQTFTGPAASMTARETASAPAQPHAPPEPTSAPSDDARMTREHTDAPSESPTPLTDDVEAPRASPVGLADAAPAAELEDPEPPAPAQQEASLAVPWTPQARRVSPPEGGAGRAGALLRLARDMAAQALASEGMGRAVGVAQGLFGALRAGLGTGGSTSLDVYGRDAALVSDLGPVLDFLYERYWRVTVQGAELIPSGPVVLVANHSGALPFDGPVMQLALGRERPDLAEARWLAEDQVFHAPVLGTLFNRLGAVRACQENAARLLEEGRPVVVFPEGIQGLSKPFAQRYQLKRFGRGGFVKLALRCGAPIVPVAIVGAEETSPLLARLPGEFLGLPYLPLTPLGPLPLPAKWSIRFGEPLPLGDAGPEAAEDLSEVQRLTERTRESIQGMLQAQLQERRSVFAG